MSNMPCYLRSASQNQLGELGHKIPSPKIFCSISFNLKNQADQPVSAYTNTPTKGPETI